MARLSMNVTTTGRAGVVDDVRIAKAAGYAGIELQSPKLLPWLDAGGRIDELVALLDGLEVTGIGAVLDLERDGAGRTAYLHEVERLAAIARAVGAPQVQLCTGPVDAAVVRDHRAGALTRDDPRYRGTLGRSERDAVAAAAHGVALAADVAAEHGVGVYLEPLAWSNVNRLAQTLRIIELVDRPNVRLVVDTWHFWTVGDTLEEVAALPAHLIGAVHISDGFDLDRARVVPDQGAHRDVVIGGGAIPLQQWVDAVRATGYDGWYLPEMFSHKAADHDPLEVATAMRVLLDILVA